MSESVNQLLAQWAELWSSHRTDKFLELFTDDCVYEDVTLSRVSKGKNELREFLEETVAIFPDFRIEPRSHFATASGDRACLEWTMSGTQQGDAPGIPATHKKMTARGISAIELKDSKIHRVRDYWDNATVLGQFGLLPKP
jgi:steroid delta-isomerase-like uncharacterized protein